MWLLRFVPEDWYDPAEDWQDQGFRDMAAAFGAERMHAIRAQGRWSTARWRWLGGHGIDQCKLKELTRSAV